MKVIFTFDIDYSVYDVGNLLDCVRIAVLDTPHEIPVPEVCVQFEDFDLVGRIEKAKR